MILSILQMVAGNAPPVGTVVPQLQPVMVAWIEQVAVAPFESVIVNVTVVVPSETIVPGAGDWTISVLEHAK